MHTPPSRTSKVPRRSVSFDRESTMHPLDSPHHAPNVSRCHVRLKNIVRAWRGLALHWQKQNVPGGSYERLVRASISEVPADERNAIRQDILRSQPIFATAPWSSEALDVAAHAARLERVLCAWTQYDQEIGYVQAMNLLTSTLLLLLEGDEEATFWTLVTLLRQLPPHFYARAPLQLLGFWTEVEVLSQLAGRLLELNERERIGVRDALLQVAPRWMLEFWVGTLPLEMIVMVWDHMLRGAHATAPSVLGLQVSLALLFHLKPQIHTIFAEATSADIAQHRAFALMHGVRVPDASAGWLLLRAQQVRLHVGAVHEMRLQLRITITESAGRNPPSGVLPLARGPADITSSKPQPLVVFAGKYHRGLGSKPATASAALRPLCSPSAHVAALALVLGALVVSSVLWVRTIVHYSCGTPWEVQHLEDLSTLLIVLTCVLVGWRWGQALAAAAVGTSVAALFFASKAIAVVLACVRCDSHARRLLEEDTAYRGGVAADTDRWESLSVAVPPPPPPPPPPSPHPPPPCNDASCDDCWTLHGVWPLALCATVVVIAILEILQAVGRRRERRRERRSSAQYTPAAWPDAEAARAEGTARDNTGTPPIN